MSCSSRAFLACSGMGPVGATLVALLSGPASRPLRGGIFLLLLLPSVSWAQAQKTWEFSLGTIAPGNSPYMKIARDAMDKVEAKTKGQVRFKLYASGVQGDEPQLVEKVRKGDLTGGFFTVSGIGEMSPEFSLLLVPFLFRNDKEIEYVREKMFDTFQEAFRRHGFDLIVWADIGFGELFSKVPIKTLNDLRARKVWAWPGEKLFPALAKFLGLEAIPVPLAQVMDALRDGRLDTVYANALGSVVLGWYREVGYVMKWDLIYGPAVLAVGLPQWSAVPPGIRKIVLEEIESTMPKLFDVMRRDEETALKGINKRGVQILQLDPQVEEEFRAISEGVERKLVEGKPELVKILDEIHMHIKEFRSSTASAPHSLDFSSYAR